MFQRAEALPSPTGASLNLLSTLAASAPRGVVQINHGLAEHAARYDRFAGVLAARGFHVYAHDHRGHGGTTAPDAPAGSFAGPGEPAGGGGKVIADVLAVHDEIARRHPRLPVVLFGHSMGGLIGMNFVHRHATRIAAAAIWNANFSAGAAGRAAQAILAWERFRLGSDVPSRILPRLTFGAWAKEVENRRTPFDWLSRDDEEVAKYIADPLCGWDASVGMWQAVFGFVFDGADNRSYDGVRRDMPFNLVGGGKDPATAGGRAVAHLSDRMAAMGFSNLRTTVYADTRHESLNELNRDLIMEELAGWLDGVLSDARG
jgi:alpha-beta hydrolase superfamily lysophospholipase